MSTYSCWTLMGLIVLALSFVACSISFAAPYWVHDDRLLGIGKVLSALPISRTYGLWGECTKDGCNWFFENDFRWENKQEDWVKASQGLFGFGVVTIFAAFLVACMNLCCTCCREAYSVVNVVSGLLIFAFLEIGTACALYGYKSNEADSVDLSGSPRFIWGYWLGCGGAGATLLAGLLYCCGSCAARRYDGYDRTAVV